MTASAALLTRRPEQSARPDELPIRLLIVDDSSVTRAVIARVICAQPGFEVVANASSAAEALSLLSCINVDVVLLDVEMPGGSGLDALPEIVKAGRGARVVVVSSSAGDGGETASRALSLGAAAALPKPGAGMFGQSFPEILAERLRRLGRLGPVAAEEHSAAAAQVISLRQVQEWEPECIAIGASTGGINAIHDFLTALPARIGVPIFVTQHLPPLFMPYFARQLADLTGRTARVVADGEAAEADHIHVAPGTAHLRLARHGSAVRVMLDRNPAPSGCLPSVDPMLESVGEVYGRGGIGVMLSGMGRDGLIGSGRLVANGGIVLTQDQHSSAIWGMPRAVAEAGLASAMLPPRELGQRLGRCLGEAAWR